MSATMRVALRAQLNKNEQKHMVSSCENLSKTFYLINLSLFNNLDYSTNMNNNISQTEAEINTLLESYKDLQDAKRKFKESLDAIKVQSALPNDKSILVPLTGSMYVPGHITNTNEFLVDIGTQYLVEKDASGAIDYFERKMKFIDVQLEKFSQLLQTRLVAKQNAAAATQQAVNAAAAAASSSKQKIK